MTHDGRQQNLQPGNFDCSEEDAHRTYAGNGNCFKVSGGLGSSGEEACRTNAGSQGWSRMTGDDPASEQQAVQPGQQTATGSPLPVKAHLCSMLAEQAAGSLQPGPGGVHASRAGM